MARGSRRSSASRNTTYEVSSAASPVFRAAANPRFSCRIRRTFGKPRDDVGRVVRRSIVDDDHGIGRTRLGADTLEGLLQEMGVIVGRHYHADSRRRG